MQCETCHGSGSVGPLPIPCGDCGGSGVAHCCDGIREQRDPGDETPDAHGFVYPSGRGNCTPYYVGKPMAYDMGCANDCCHPDHRHNVAVAETVYCGECFQPFPDTRAEWRELNDGAD